MLKKLLIGILAGVPFIIKAQSFYAIKHQRSLTVYGGTGTAAYLGEMVNPKSLGSVRYNLVAGSEYFITSRISARAEVVWFRVSGSDANANDDRVERNLSFTSNCQEFSFGGTFYFLPEKKGYFQRLSFNAYAFAGTGVFKFNPKAEYQGSVHALQPLRTENVDYSRTSVIVPYGLGVRIRATPLFNVLVEAGYRKTFTDYIDDISSKRYVDPTLLSSDLSRALADRRKERDPEYPALYTLGVRGNPDKKDSYFLMNIKVQYYLRTSFGRQSNYNNIYRKKRKAFNPKRG